ncbi:MAG: HzsA-related protein, partial [Planctomycetota bacterium]
MKTIPSLAPAAVLISAGILAALAVTPREAEAGKPPENLAPKARITADSEHSGQHQAKFVADGHIPRAGGKNDAGKAWCVNGETHRNGAVLTFEWDEPVAVAEVVYYGRTAWEPKENWKDYEVYFDYSAKPVLKGRLKTGHGPQRIKLTGDNLLVRTPPGKIRKLLLRFTSSYGGSNPGASEIQVYPTSPPRSLLGKFALPPGAVEESDELAADLKDGKLGFERLVVIQRHELNPTHVYTYHNEGFRAGGGLYVFTPDDGDGKLKELVASPKGQILDCDVSYDGKEIIFSWRQTGGDTYHVYRIGADGTGLAQIARGKWHDFNACWLPDGDIAFLSSRRPAFAYCWTSPVGILHRMDRDGGNVLQLSANYLNDFTPSVLNDGTIIYSRWEYVDRPAIPIQGMWTINPDGTRLRVFYGNRVLSPATFMEPQAIPGSTKVLCVLTAHNGPCRGGIGIIDRTRGVNAQEAIRNLTPEVNIGHVDRGDGNRVRGPYESPYPINGEYYLVSRRGTTMIRDYGSTKQLVLLSPRGGMGFYGARPIRPRPRPPVRGTGLAVGRGKTDGWATVYVQDVYNGLEPHVKRGEIKQIRVVQEIEKSRFAHVNKRAFGFQFPVVSCGATYAPKKVWGHAPVAEDGSARFKVPSCAPIYFMAIDGRGRAVQRMRSFTHLMPGEVQGCVGCHES